MEFTIENGNVLERENFLQPADPVQKIKHHRKDKRFKERNFSPAFWVLAKNKTLLK